MKASVPGLHGERGSNALTALDKVLSKMWIRGLFLACAITAVGLPLHSLSAGPVPVHTTSAQSKQALTKKAKRCKKHPHGKGCAPTPMPTYIRATAPVHN